MSDVFMKHRHASLPPPEPLCARCDHVRLDVRRCGICQAPLCLLCRLTHDAERVTARAAGYESICDQIVGTAQVAAEMRQDDEQVLAGFLGVVPPPNNPHILPTHPEDWRIAHTLLLADLRVRK
jgi:hypothetical protein